MEFAVVFAAVDKPDIFVLLTNLSSAFSWFTLFLRWFLIAAALVWMVLSFANLWAVSTANGGQPNKFFPTRSQPTSAGAWMQMVVAGITFILAYKMVPMSVFTSLITGESTGVQIYSIGSYDLANVSSTDARAIIRDLFITVMQFVGFLAYYRGLSTWYHMGQGTTEHRPSRIAGYFFFGTLCLSVDWVNSLIANTLGFDLFGFFM